jgi:thiamine transport system permease protein
VTPTGRHRPAASTGVAGILALLLIVGIIGLAFAGLMIAGGTSGVGGSWGYIRRLVLVSLGQAALSTLLSLILGAALALALARRERFPGRGLMIAAMNVATVLPPIVAVFAIVAVFGRSGWLGDLTAFVGLDLGSWLYGLPGILIAHVFFNAPLAARSFLAALASVTPEHWRLASHLGLPPATIFRIIDRPILLREAPGIAGIVFLLCFTSFAVVLALGGGPNVSTLEVAIFEALRFEAEFARAAILALLQIVICLALLLPIGALARRPQQTVSSGVIFRRTDRDIRSLRILDAFILLAGAALIMPPLLAILFRGIAGIPALVDPNVTRAVWTSLAIGIPAGLIGTALALALADLSRRLRIGAAAPRAADAVGLVAIMILVVSPMALSAGLFIMLRPVINPLSVGLPLIVLVNALMALPFAYRQIEPPLTLAAERYGRLADSLGIGLMTRVRLVDWPLLRRPLIVAIAIAIALSLGDLGVASFFGTGDLVTLPVLIHRLLGTYRMEEAASVSLLLSLLVLGLFLAAQRWSGDWIARAR